MRPYYADDSVTLYHGERYCEIAANRLTQGALDLTGGA